MVKSCCIEGCNAFGDGVEYFKFPVSRTLRAAWLAACGAAGDAVCAAHFADGDYKSARGARRLRATAVPSVGLAQKPPPPAEKSTDPAESAQTNCTEKNAKSNKKDGRNKKNKRKKEEQLETTDIEEAIDKVILKKAGNKSAVEKGRLKKIESKEIDNTQGATRVKENGVVDDITESVQTEEKDIEDMITNYQIKQTKTPADILNPEPLEDLIPAIMADHKSKDIHSISDQTKHKHGHDGMVNTKGQDDQAGRLDSATVSQIASRLASKLDDQLGYGLTNATGADSAPVFIEVPVERSGGSRAASPQDCLMLLESVQCDVDPTALMLEPEPDSESDMEIVDIADHKKPDPISLLTSSDEDEVIIQEPKIDTVEVSDETDEDDRPLLALVKKPKTKPKPVDKPKTVWGMYQYCCVQCNYKTDDETNFKKHNLELDHSTTIQVCPNCNYTTASKAQFARHRRKHKDERNYKCHLCNYKARHNMSLMYHLKSHNSPAERIPKFTCDKCGFFSDVKSEGLSHIKSCDDGRYLCDLCNYTTKRRSDLKRHRRRRHSVDDNDEDFTM